MEGRSFRGIKQWRRGASGRKNNGGEEELQGNRINGEELQGHKELQGK